MINCNSCNSITSVIMTILIPYTKSFQRLTDIFLKAETNSHAKGSIISCIITIDN